MKGIIVIGLGLLVPAAGSWQTANTLARPAYASGAGPRVLYDTAHWNPSLDDGRYRAVADLLRADGYRIEGGAIPFEMAALGGYDILLSVTPYAADRASNPAEAARPVFSDAQCDTLEAWVRKGGKLLFVVGHQPSGIAHANLAARFGIELRNGSAMDATPANNWVDGHASCGGCLKFTRENGLLRLHPITEGRDAEERVMSVISAVGQSIAVRNPRDILLAMGPDSYDVLPDKRRLPAKGRAQAVAVSAGAGRVVVIGDGSILSGFTYGAENPGFRRWWPKDPDNRQFTLNVMHWLSGLLPGP
ncbi:MAG: DUF4350 domain-containing protein [Vicinamibacterales bacterium]